jgi:hypothetical protein
MLLSLYFMLVFRVCVCTVLRLAELNNYHHMLMLKCEFNSCQSGAGDCFRNAFYNGTSFRLDSAWAQDLPPAGSLRFDYVSPTKPPDNMPPSSGSWGLPPPPMDPADTTATATATATSTSASATAGAGTTSSESSGLSPKNGSSTSSAGRRYVGNTANPSARGGSPATVKFAASVAGGSAAAAAAAAGSGGGGGGGGGGVIAGTSRGSGEFGSSSSARKIPGQGQGQGQLVLSASTVYTPTRPNLQHAHYSSIHGPTQFMHELFGNLFAKKYDPRSKQQILEGARVPKNIPAKPARPVVNRNTGAFYSSVDLFTAQAHPSSKGLFGAGAGGTGAGYTGGARPKTASAVTFSSSTAGSGGGGGGGGTSPSPYVNKVKSIEGQSRANAAYLSETRNGSGKERNSPVTLRDGAGDGDQEQQEGTVEDDAPSSSSSESSDDGLDNAVEEVNATPAQVSAKHAFSPANFNPEKSRNQHNSANSNGLLKKPKKHRKVSAVTEAYLCEVSEYWRDTADTNWVRLRAAYLEMLKKKLQDATAEVDPSGYLSLNAS